MLIGNLPRLAEAWPRGLRTRTLQTFPLAFTGDQGNISCTDAPIYLDEALAEINDRITIRSGANEDAMPPVRHVHTQVYHRSRVTLRRVRAVQDMCMGYFVPRIALREYTSKRAETALRRINGLDALESDGKGSERRFKQKLADSAAGMRYESVVMINMEFVQENVKTSK